MQVKTVVDKATVFSFSIGIQGYDSLIDNI